MKILRSTMFTDDAGPPMTVVLREIDVKVWQEATTIKPLPGACIVNEVFDMPGTPSIEQAVAEAGKRTKAREIRDRNIAMLYHWDGGALARVNPGGVLSGTQPAPLDEEDIKSVLIQLAQHPNYKGQTVLVISSDGNVVRMKDGKVSSERMKR